MKIIADSSALYSPEEGARIGVQIIPVCVAINGETYRDYEEITPEEFLAHIEKGGMPTSSQPAIGDVMEVFEDGSEEKLTMTPGSALKQEDMPKIPEKEGFAGQWVGPAWVDPEHVSFDADYSLVYTELRSVLQSSETNEAGLPLLLVQGRFADGEQLLMTEGSGQPAANEGEEILFGHGVVLPVSSEPMQLRVLLADSLTEETLRVAVQDAEGNWRDAESHMTRSYLVFDVQEGDTAFCVIQIPADYTLIWLSAGGGAALVLLIVCIVIGKRIHKKRKNSK